MIATPHRTASTAATADPAPRCGWREMLIAALVLALIAALALRPSIRGNDGYGNYVYLASLLSEGDLDFRDEYAQIDALENYPYKLAELPRDPATERPSNRYGVGSALLWFPFAAVAHGAVSSEDTQPEGLGPIYARAVGLGTAFWGSLGLLLLYLRLRAASPRWASAAMIAGLIFATPLGFYLYAHGSMSHGVSFFAAVLLALSFESAWRTPRTGTLCACAAACALLVMIRAQDASWALLAAGAVAWRMLAAREWPMARRLAALALAALVGVLFFAPQLAAWRYLYGSALAGPMPYLDDSAGSFAWIPRHALQALFSARHGVLAWHPLIAALLIATLCTARRATPDAPLARFALVGFVLQTWLIGCWSMWWAGASFGNRFFISALPFLAVGAAPVLGKIRTRAGRALAIAALALLCAWNAGLLVQYATGMISREEAVNWPQVLRQNLMDVPSKILN